MTRRHFHCVAIGGVAGATAQADELAGKDGVLSWYSGDWRSGVVGVANWYVSGTEFSRVYDTFAVPAPGWNVTAVFTDNAMEHGATMAAWEIRQGMAPGKSGTLIGWGIHKVTQTQLAEDDPPLKHYRIQVSGLNLKLSPGSYWLSVAPVAAGQSYASATVGENAKGGPRLSSGVALLHSTSGHNFMSVDQMHFPKGQSPKHFSQGVIALL